MGFQMLLARALPARLAVAAVLLLAGCSSSGPPHSDYFVVFFPPSSAEPLPEGRAALARAGADAHRGSPRAVLVTGYLSSDGTGRELSQQRMQAVAQGLARDGVPKTVIRIAPETVTPAAFARLGNGVTVQVARGIPPEKPAEPAQGD